MAERRAEIVGDGVEQGLELGRGRAERGAALGHAPLQLAGLPRELLAEPRVLDGDGQRGRDLEGDVAVLRREPAGVSTPG